MKFKRRFYRKFKYNRKRSFMFIFLFLLCLSFGLGYSLISTDLNIFGTTVLKDNRWSVYFDNIQEIEGSVSPTVEPEITDNTTVSFSAKLKNPGDKYEFLIDVVNDGTIDAKIGNISMSPILTTEQQQFFSYEVTYESGVSLDLNQALDAGSTETLKVSFKYREQEDNSLYPDTDQTFNVVLTGEYVQGTGTPVNHQYLYDVLRKEAESGGLARKYTGNHHDSFTEEPSKDIYRWSASNNTQGTQVLNKNNVIFANHCWQMIRTTDTGGVKMIYNGEVENEQCLNTRGNHVGYNDGFSTNVSDGLYWYGTDYVYNKENNTFSISGEKKRVRWSQSTSSSIIGYYTCFSSNENGTCSNLYIVLSYYNSTRANVIRINAYSRYSQFGILNYNLSYNSPSYVGYMYNEAYPIKKQDLKNTESMLSSLSLTTTYWYADSVTWGAPTADNYNLNNPYQVSSTSDYPNIVGKYSFGNTSQTYTHASVYYIAGVGGSTMYYIQLGNETDSTHDLNYYNYTYTYGDSYTDNGNGTYTINNPTTVNRSDWYTSYGNVGSDKYMCKNATNNMCSELWYTVSTSASSIQYVKLEDDYKFANGFSYDINTNTYTLNNDFVSFFDISLNSLNDHHYTCWNISGTCSSLSYVYSVDRDLKYIYTYIDVSDGKGIGDILNEMLFDSNVNKNESIMKIGIDAWYKHFLLDYDDKIEDIIFCGDRSISNFGGWNPNGGSTYSNTLLFYGSGDLVCLNDTDKFSISNNLAKLTYKVGLLDYREANLLHSSIRKSSDAYWLISPEGIYDSSVGNARVFCIEGNGTTVHGNAVHGEKGVRPVISLKPKTKYLSGDGSMESPYVIN